MHFHEYHDVDRGTARLYYVIPDIVINAIFLFINIWILSRELKRRCHAFTTRQSSVLKWSSLMVLVLGVTLPTTGLLYYIPGTCIWIGRLQTTLFNAKDAFFFFYEWARLYQLFGSKKNVHSYPRWLLAAQLVFYILHRILLEVGVHTKVPNDCGYDWSGKSNYEYYERGTRLFSAKFDYDVITPVSWLPMHLSEFALLLLFVHKLRKITKVMEDKGDSAILTKIQRNTFRVTLLTVLTLIIQIIYCLYWFYQDYWYHKGHVHLFTDDASFDFVWMTNTTFSSYALYLMMPHNSDDYGRFLNLLISLKLHHCCCGRYRYTLKEQRDHFLPQYKAVFKISASGMDMEMPMIAREETRAETGTAFNDFSIDEVPSTKYQAPTLPLIVVSPQKSNYGDSTLQIIPDHATSTSPPPISPPTPSDGINNSMAPSNDFLFETESKEEFSTGFSFGVYLEYWRRNRRNSVRPKYKTLKEELTMNRHATITEREYERLSQQCLELRKEHKFIAKDVGSMNRICGITPGSEMTLDHMITIKLYTDFTEQQTVFKRQCRRLYGDEPIESVMARNREIAHWSRLLRECIMFYGEGMRASDVVYCGLNHHLIFRSMNARFECPLSTTKTLSVAQQFAEDGRGIILKLKRANPKTRYFNVRPFTVFKNEDERLFSGSTLKIMDILLKKKSLKRYVNALRMLEEIVNGYFISGGQQTRDLLLSLLERVVEPSVMDVMGESMKWKTLRRNLDDDGYDTDALLDDVEDEMDSNIMERVGNYEQGVVFLEFIKQTQDNLLDVDSIPKYVWFLFIIFLDEIKAMMKRGDLWVNHYDLDRREYSAIKAVLFGNNQIFDVLSIDKERIPMVQQYQWMITGSVYDDLKALPIAEYIASPQFQYELITDSDHHQITFHFRFYSRYSVEEPQCAIFLELDDIPDGVKRLRIEIDMKCYKKKDFRHLLRSRDLSKERMTLGFISFRHDELNRNKMMQWMFGVKVLNVDKVVVDEEEEYLRDLYQIFE